MPTYTSKLQISAAFKAARTEADLQAIHLLNAVFITNDSLLKREYLEETIRVRQAVSAARIPVSDSYGDSDYSLNAGQQGI